jgi:hypothetical protein
VQSLPRQRNKVIQKNSLRNSRGRDKTRPTIKKLAAQENYKTEVNVWIFW